MAFLLNISDAIKVKKTDLPVVPSEQEVLPSFDDEPEDSHFDTVTSNNNNNNNNDNDDEDDEDMDDDDMMADEASDSDDDDEYDDEDEDDIDDNYQQEDADAWGKLSTPEVKKDAVGVPTLTSTTSTTTPKTTEQPSSASSAPVPVVDPYFTHFDPRSEHTSYKVIESIVVHW